MFIFILALVIGGPIAIISAFLSAAWVWEYLRGCFFSLSNYCGQSHIFKAMIFGAIAYGCFLLIKSTWEKTK